MTNFGDDLIRSLQEVLAHVKGENSDMIVHEPDQRLRKTSRRTTRNDEVRVET